MKYFIKNAEGLLVEASSEDMMNSSTVLYNAEGEVVNRQPVEKGDDPVAELANVVKELAITIGGNDAIKAKQEELEAKMASYTEMAKRGFQMPSWEPGETGEDTAEKYAPYDLAKQGKRLVDKIHHPGYRPSEESRIELAKFFTLFLRAGVFQDQTAKYQFKEKYGELADQGRAKTALGESGNDSFPIPDIVEAEILAFAREVSVAMQYARTWEMTSEALSIPRESAAATTNWGFTTDDGTPEGDEVQLDAVELSSYAGVRKATMMDARSDVVSWFTEALSEAAGQAIDDQAFNGTGAGLPTQPFTGLFNESDVIAYVMAATNVDFSDITATDLSAMIGELNGKRKMGARYFMHGSILHYIRSLKDTQDRPIFIETVGAPMSGTIWGYPYSEVITCPAGTDTAVSTPFMVFGSMRNLALGRRLEVSSLEANPFLEWKENRILFKLYQRWGIKVGLPAGFVKAVTAAA